MSCASNDALAFTSSEDTTDVWLLPIDLDRGKLTGRLERISHSPAVRNYAALSKDGRYVAFASDQSGRTNVWIRDLATGRESMVGASPFVQTYPLMNASGSKVAYSVFEREKRTVYVASPGATPEKLCEDCLRATDWARDGKTLLLFGRAPYQIDVLDLASHGRSPLLKHPKHHLLFGRFSPDNRWVSFLIRTDPNRGRIAVAPAEGPKPIPESAWIDIAEVGSVDWADWAPHGNTLYYSSPRDGYNCLWGQRLDPSSYRPAGAPFAVQHLHGSVSYQQRGFSTAGGRIAMVLNETTGNIWMMSPSSAR